MARNKYPEETKKLIIEKATELFLQKGYENTTVQDIIDNLGGLTKGAVYHHFSSKKDILLAVMTSIYAENHLLSDWEKVVKDESLNGKEKIKKMFALSLTDPDEMRFASMKVDYKKSPELLSDYLNKSVNHLAPCYFEPAINDGIKVIQQLPTEGLSHLVDEVVEVHLTGQHAVHLLVDLHDLEGGGDGGLCDTAEPLTPDALSTIGGVGHHEQVTVSNLEDVLVAQSDVAEIDQSVEILVALEALDDGAGQDLFDQSEQTDALAVADVFVVHNGGTVVGSDQSLAQSVHGLVH